MDIEQSPNNIHTLWVPNADTMREHLEHLFGGYLDGYHDGLIELGWTATTPDEDGRYPLRYASLYPTDQIEELVQKAISLNATEHCNVYIGAALRKPGTFPGGRASDSDFLALTCLYVDLDDDGATARARDRYHAAKPTKVVVTGKAPYPRAQAWWRLQEPIYDPIQSEAALKGMAQALGGDPVVTNPARVMRLAGSIAWPMKPGRVIEQTYIAPLKEPGQAEYDCNHLARLFPPVASVASNGINTGVSRETTVLGLPGKVIDGRDDYLLRTTEAILIELIGEAGRCPTGQELYDRVWPQYDRNVDPNKPRKREDYVSRKCSYTIRRFLEGKIRKLPDIATAIESYRAKRDNYRLAPEPPLVDPATGQPPAIKWLDMSNWDSVPVPTRKWAIRDRVPLNQVGLFSGEGGTGKSIIELMKNVAHVTGTDWLGSMPEQGGAFYLGAEDEAEEIHIRLAAIAKHARTTFKELIRLGLKVLPLLGEDSMLCVQTRGNHIETTPLYRQLYEAAGDLKPKNISIDTLSRAFGGDEINRVQVYAFAMHMQALAKVAQGSVTILSHPSLAGIASGSGISGSTAWHGAFRFRQYLKGIKEDDDGGEPDDLRQLEFKKNQYGPPERPIILRYVDGLFLPVNGASDPERLMREAKVDGLFVNLLRRFNARGDRVTHLVSSYNYYAPSLFAEEPEAKQQGIRKGELEDAMKRLMAVNRVLVEIFGKDSRRQSKLILTPGT